MENERTGEVVPVLTQGPPSHRVGPLGPGIHRREHRRPVIGLLDGPPVDPFTVRVVDGDRPRGDINRLVEAELDLSGGDLDQGVVGRRRLQQGGVGGCRQSQGSPQDGQDGHQGPQDNGPAPAMISGQGVLLVHDARGASTGQDRSREGGPRREMEPKPVTRSHRAMALGGRGRLDRAANGRSDREAPTAAPTRLTRRRKA